MTCRNYIPGPNGDCQRCGEMRAGHAGSVDNERDKILMEAMEAIAKEHLEEPQDDADRAYDVGVTDAYCAVKKLLSKYAK